MLPDTRFRPPQEKQYRTDPIIAAGRPNMRGINIMKKNWFKWILDLAMVVVIVLLFNKNATGENLHEIIGLALFAAFALHLILNAKWIGGVTKKFFGKMPAKTRVIYIVDFLLVVSWAVCAVTAVMISKSVFSFHAGGQTGESIHKFAAACGLLLFGVHIGLHRGFFSGMFAKLVKIPKKAGTAIGVVLTVILLVFGCYSLTTTQYLSWLRGPFMTSSMEGGEKGGYGKMEDFQPGAQNSSAATAVSGTDTSAAASGASAPQGNMPQGMQGMHGEGGQGGSFSSVLLTIARFFSIAYIFAFIAGLIDFILGRRKSAK
jgi:hypothetical protein